MMHDYHQQIQDNAKLINNLNRRIKETFLFRDGGPEQMLEWKEACREYHSKYEALAFPGGSRDARHRLRAGDDEAIEYALAFLEVRPYFFRSGYMYQEYMRVLRNCPLNASQRNRYSCMRARYLSYRQNRS